MLTVITGATGLLGGNLAIELLNQGHQVRATRRKSSRVDHLSAFDIDWVEADLDQPQALSSAFEGADAVFHCAALVSIRKTVTPALQAANVDGTANVIAAVREAGVARLIHCSTVGAVGLSEDGQPCTEEARWNFPEHDLGDGYVTTKRRSEDLVDKAVTEGLDAVVVNPTYMFGPYDVRPSSGQMIVETVKGKVPGWTPGINNFVDVRDVARGMVLAWEKGERGQRYILGGENMTYKEIFERIAKVAGVKPPGWGVPRPLATLLGWAGDLHEALTTGEPQINSMTIRYGYTPRFQFSSEKAKRMLGYKAGPVETAIADAITWFREHRML